jgi:hypothetical protein
MTVEQPLGSAMISMWPVYPRQLGKLGPAATGRRVLAEESHPAAARPGVRRIDSRRT